MAVQTSTYACASCQSNAATLSNSPISKCAMIKCSTCKYHMLLEHPGYELDTDGIHAEWIATIARQMRKKASKAEKEKAVEKAFL